jgi:hypothetical protein
LVETAIIRGAVSHPDAGHYALGLRVPAFDSIGHLCLGGREEPKALGSKIIIVDVDDGDGFVRKKIVGSFVNTGGIIAEDGLRLDMKVTHHSVAVPPAHHPDVAEIHLAMWQCHGVAGTQGLSTNLQRFDACAMDVDAHGVAQNLCDILRFHEVTAVSTIEGRNWCRQGGLVSSMQEHTVHSGLDWAAPGIAAQALNQFFVVVTIFLSGKGVGCGGG